MHRALFDPFLVSLRSVRTLVLDWMRTTHTKGTAMARKTIIAALSVFFPAFAAAQSDDFGKWISLFNGKDTTGWINAKSEDPGAKNRWTVEDGALTNETKGVNDACTVEEFEDYELEIEYRVPKDGNSGVYLRGAVEVQVFDSYGRTPEKHDAGAIYGGFVPLANPSKPAGEWNKFRVLHIGPRITVWHNDVLVQDNVVRATETPSSMTVHPKSKNKIDAARKGPIMLQGDHEKVWYRNIRIRPLFSAAAGWKPLWNGKDLSELTAREDRRAKDGLAWKVEDGAFTNAAHSSRGHDIWTKEPFGNFLVHYAYKSDPSIEGGNSGFYLRDQWEIQIYRETKLDDKHSDGCLYSIHTPLVNARHKPDQWNHMDVKVEGMKIWVWQNGKLLHDGRTCETRTDNHRAATKAFSRASFKFQGDHGKVWFTSLYIKPLPDSGPTD
jgi:hypothetical protein